MDNPLGTAWQVEQNRIEHNKRTGSNITKHANIVFGMDWTKNQWNKNMVNVTKNGKFSFWVEPRWTKLITFFKD